MFEKVHDWDFTRKVLNSHGLILLNFWTSWCAECQSISKHLYEILSRAGNKTQIYKIDWDSQRKLAEKLNVYGVPTLLLFKNGKLIRRYSGVLTAEELLKIIKKNSELDFISNGVKNL